MNSVAEWVAAIPDQVSARQALLLIDDALRDAKQATDEIVANYSHKGGTLPPPPWPQHPELQQAIKALEGGQLLLQQAINLGRGDETSPKTGPLGIRLANGGQELYRQIAVMRERMQGVKVESLPGLAAELAKKAAETRWGGLAVVAAIIWAAHTFDLDT